MARVYVDKKRVYVTGPEAITDKKRVYVSGPNAGQVAQNNGAGWIVPGSKQDKLLKIQQTQQPIQQAGQQANDFLNKPWYKQLFTKNVAEQIPHGVAETLIGTPAKFITSAAEVPGALLRGNASQRTYKLPGLDPFKSYISQGETVANDYLDNKSGLGSVAWNMAQVPLAGLEIAGIGKGVGKAATALKTGQGIKTAGMEIADAFLPTTRGLTKKASREAAALAVADIPAEAGKGSKYLAPIRSGERVLENQGQAGKTLLGLIKGEQTASDLQAGKWKSLVKQFTQQLSDEEKLNLTDVLEGKAKPLNQNVAASSVVMRNMLDKIQKEAVGSGLETGKLENYFPRKYNWSDMMKSSRKEKVLQHMVDTGQASTKAEADSFLRDFIFKNSERKAGNLEFERMFDVPGYERDPEKALTMYADSAAKRITQAKMFGKADEIPSALINKIAEGGGDYREAQKIFDYVYKGEPKNAFAQFLLGYNAFTKLSLAFFSNLTQSANTAAKGGLLNTLKGAGQALAQGVKAMRKADYNDVAVLANTLDQHVMMQETGITNKLLQGAMYFFQKVENFNRRTASNTGVLLAQELAQNPESAYAARQLKSLGIDIADVAKGKLTEKQLLTAANKMTRITQFKIDAVNLPTMWRSPLGKVLTQFKSFSFMQTKFIRDEIVKEAGKGNFAPFVRFLAVAPIASYLTQSMRNAWNKANSNPDNVDFRKGDLYRKAVGDLPTDILTQLQYAMSKKDKWYTTPLSQVKNFSSPFVGPTGGDVMQLASSLEQKGNLEDQNNLWYKEHPAAQKDPNFDLKRFATTKLPIFGRRLTNQFLSYGDTTAEKAKILAKQGLASGDYDKIKQAIEMDPYLNNQTVMNNLKKEVQYESMSDKDKQLYDQIKERNKKKVQPFYVP